MNPDPNPDCPDCEGTGIDVVFGDPCHCIGGAEKPIARPVLPGAFAPEPEPTPEPLTGTTLAPPSVPDEAKPVLLAPSTLIAPPIMVENLSDGYVLADGVVPFVGMVVQSTRTGEKGHVVGPHSAHAKLGDQHYRKIKVRLPDGTVTTRSANRLVCGS